MIDNGQKYGLDPNHEESQHQVCNHRSVSGLSGSGADERVVFPKETGKAVRIGGDNNGLSIFEYILLFVMLVGLFTMFYCCCCINDKDIVVELDPEAPTDEENNDNGRADQKKSKKRKSRRAKSSLPTSKTGKHHKLQEVDQSTEVEDSN